MILMRITISGKPGSGKSTVAKIIAERLGMKHYSIGDFMREIAEREGISLLELGDIAVKEDWVDKELDKKQIELGMNEDYFVIDSRLGFYFIPNSLKVFLDVELEEGAKRVFNSERPDEKNATFEDTIVNIKRRMRCERARYKKYYRVDCYDIKNYDLVINTTNVPPEKVAEEIMVQFRAQKA